MENPFTTEKPVRPTFLTVLCILSFIGSGWNTIDNLISLLTFTPEKGVAQLQQITSMASAGMDSSFIQNLMSSSIEVIQTTIAHSTGIYTFLTLFSLISLAGAFMMFNLKRVGFFLYVFAQVGQLFVLPAYSGWNLAVMIAMILTAIFALLFIILYGANYRKLR